MELPTKCYNIDTANSLYKKDKDKGLKYVLSYFFKIANPVGVMYYNAGSKSFTYNTLSDTIEAYIPNAIYYHETKKHSLITDFKDYKDPYIPTVAIDKPIFYKDNGNKYLNTFTGLPKIFDTKTKYKDFKQEDKDGVEFILNHLNDVWCSHDENLFKYLKNWIINVITLKRNETALYLKSQQGTGKSSITDFLMDFLSSNLGHFASSPDVIMKWNAPLKGKVLLVLEEMPSSSVSEWKAYNARLKSYITNPILDTEDKYMPRQTTPNYLNVIINSNENAIKLDNSDRRYVCLDISNEKVGNTEYFEKLHNHLKNEQVKKCFYAYCVENQDKDFNPRKIPITETKKDIMVDNMNDIMKYIKNNYLLKKLSINMKFQDFFNQYTKSGKRAYTKIQVSKLIDEYKIKTEIRAHNYKWLVMTFDELYELFKTKNLIHETDEFEEETEQVEEERSD